MLRIAYLGLAIVAGIATTGVVHPTEAMPAKAGVQNSVAAKSGISPVRCYYGKAGQQQNYC